MRFSLKSKKILLTAENFLEYDNRIWFTELDCNELYCYDLRDGSTRMVCKFDEEAEYQNRLFSELAVRHGKIYVIPFAATRMYEVDILTGEVKKIEIKKPDKEFYPAYIEQAKFFSGHSFQNCIYLTGASYPAIVEYNCLTGDVNYYDAWVKELCRYAKNERKVFFRKTMMVGGKIYAPSCMGNFVLEFDTETHNHTLYTVGSEKSAYSAICQAADLMWLSPMGGGPVVKWNIHTNQWKEYWDFPDGYVSGGMSFGDIACLGNYIYCIPLNSNMLIRVELQGELIEEYKLRNMETANMSLCFAGHAMYLFSQMSSQFIALGDNNSGLKELFMPEEQERRHIKHTFCTDQMSLENGLVKAYKIIYECFTDKLGDYLEFIMDNDLLEKRTYSGFLSGHAIYGKLTEGHRL